MGKTWPWHQVIAHSYSQEGQESTSDSQNGFTKNLPQYHDSPEQHKNPLPNPWLSSLKIIHSLELLWCNLPGASCTQQHQGGLSTPLSLSWAC